MERGEEVRSANRGDEEWRSGEKRQERREGEIKEEKKQERGGGQWLLNTLSLSLVESHTHSR